MGKQPDPPVARATVHVEARRTTRRARNPVTKEMMDVASVRWFGVVEGGAGRIGTEDCCRRGHTRASAAVLCAVDLSPDVQLRVTW